MMRSTITSNMMPSSNRLPTTTTGMIHTRGFNSPPPPLQSTYIEQHLHLHVTLLFHCIQIYSYVSKRAFIITPTFKCSAADHLYVNMLYPCMESLCVY